MTRVALVTGASAGIGHAVACELATLGARVAINARREERLVALAQELHERLAGQRRSLDGGQDRLALRSLSHDHVEAIR